MYVAPFPGPGGATLISTSGGGNPRWRGDGKEIFYLNMPAGRLMAAEVKSTDGALQVGPVRELFGVRPMGARSQYDVTADGQRFLVATNATEPQPSAPPPMTVVVNWTAEFK